MNLQPLSHQHGIPMPPDADIILRHVHQIKIGFRLDHGKGQRRGAGPQPFVGFLQDHHIGIERSLR